MAFFYILLVIAAFIFGILNVKLFFKVWHMCDNVAKITEKLCGMDENTNTTQTICESVSATETPEEQKHNTETPEQKNHNTNLGLIIAFVFLLFMFLMIIMS